MKFTCTSCHSVLKTPPGLELEAGQNIQLRCPRCSHLVKLRLRLSDSPHESSFYRLDFFLAMLRTLKSRFWQQNLVESHAPAEWLKNFAAWLHHHYIVDRSFTSFNFLMLMASVFFTAGIIKMSWFGDITAVGRLWPALAGMLLYGLLIAFFYFNGPRAFDGDDHDRHYREYRFFTGLLHASLVVCLFLFLYALLPYLLSGLVIPGGLSWSHLHAGAYMLILVSLLLVTGRFVYYAVLQVLLVYIHLALAGNTLLDLARLDLIYLDRSTAALAGGIAPNSVFVYYLIHLAVGPLLSALVLSLFASLRPLKCRPEDRSRAAMMITLQLALISLFFILATSLLEHVVIFAVYCLLAFVFYLVTWKNKDRFFFSSALWLLVLALLTLGRIKGNLAADQFSVLLLVLLVCASVPGLFTRFRGRRQKMNLRSLDWLPPGRLPLRHDYFRQAAVLVLISAAGFYWQGGSQATLWYIACTVVGAGLLYLHHPGTSMTARSVPWLMLCAGVSGLFVKSGFDRWGVAWMLTAFVLAVLAVMYKRYFQTAYEEEIKHNFYDLDD